MAKYLIDANLPRYFSLWASADYAFVADIDASWPDSAIWDHAARNGLTIVTKDADFTDRALLSRAGPHVIHIRAGNMKMRVLHEFLSRNWADICRLSEDARLVQVYADRIEAID